MPAAMGSVSCPTSRLGMVSFSRERSIQPILMKEYREMKVKLDESSNSSPVPFHAYSRSIKTAPPAPGLASASSSSSRSNNYNYHRLRTSTSKPDIGPFKENKISNRAPITSTKHPKQKKIRNTKSLRKSEEYFKDRSYMADLYPWARACENAQKGEIKGVDLTASIMNYKPRGCNEDVFSLAKEDSLRAGMGYDGYMDCLLRGRRHPLNRKPWGITGDLGKDREQPTLVPNNSMIKE